MLKAQSRLLFAGARSRWVFCFGRLVRVLCCTRRGRLRSLLTSPVDKTKVGDEEKGPCWTTNAAPSAIL